MFRHAIGINPEAGLVFPFIAEVRPDVHPAGVPPHEERLAVLMRLVHELDRVGGDFVVHGFHAFDGQRTGVLNLLSANFAEARIDGRVVFVRRETVNHAARPKLCEECRALRVVGIFRFLVRVQVVEVAEEFVEAVNRGQKLVTVAEMVLTELAGGVAERLQQFGNRHVFLLQPFRCA